MTLILLFMALNELTYKIRGIIFEVYNHLGPGLLESVYEAALLCELEMQGIQAKSQVSLPVIYKGTDLELGFRADILIENQVIIEVKSIEALLPIHKKQLLNYLKLSNITVGFLVNFNSDTLNKDAFIRIVNNF